MENNASATEQNAPVSEGFWKYRRWITLLQDHFHAGDKKFWRDSLVGGPVKAVRDELGIARAGLQRNELSKEMRAKLKTAIDLAERRFDTIETDTWWLFRLLVIAGTVPFIAWTLYTAIALREWGQFIAQMGVLSRTLSIAISVFNYPKSTGTIIYKHYEDRVVGGLAALILFTVTVAKPYRYLHGAWGYTTIVGGLTGFVLLCFWRDPWQRAAAWLKRGRTKCLQGEARVWWREFRNRLHDKVGNLQEHIELKNDLGDRERDRLLLGKEATDLLLRAVNAILPTEDARSQPRYPKRPKVPLLGVTVTLLTINLGASYRYPWYMAETAGWGIWQIARMLYCLRYDYISQNDTARLFSNIVAGGATILPLNLAILFTKGRILHSRTNKILLTVVTVLIVNLFSNLIGTAAKAFGNRLGKSKQDDTERAVAMSQ